MTTLFRRGDKVIFEEEFDLNDMAQAERIIEELNS